MLSTIQFRYDFTAEEQTRNPVCIIGKYLEGFHSGIVGVENRNKWGEEIKRHMHYNFFYEGDEKEAKKFVARVAKRIQRENQELEEKDRRTKGYYSCVVVKEVKDFDRWLRYCLKQYDKFSDWVQDPKIKIPINFDAELQWKIGAEEYLRDREFLSRQREKKDRGLTTFEKILDAIREENVVFKNRRDIHKFICDYYNDKDIPIDRLKTQSMMDSISLRCGLMTQDEHYALVDRR